MSGHEGWISIFEDDSVRGTGHSSPQALHVDRESLSLTKEIAQNEYQIGNGVAALSDSLVYKAAKPQGEVVFEFRSADILKVLYSHFQLGTIPTTSSPYRYQFYPRRNGLNYEYQGTYARAAYGTVVGRPYSVSLLKKIHSTTSYGGTNAFFYKHGVCDKLRFGVMAGNDAKASAHFFFRDFDAGTAVSGNAGTSTVGEYASTPPFAYWSATALMDGASVELSGLDFTSDQVVQENSRVGRQGPEDYKFSAYKLRGNFTLDLPGDAFKHVGSMFDGRDFALVATFHNSASDQLVVSMPCCRRLPFDYTLSPGHIQGQIPFQAFEKNGTSPITVTVDTTYPFSPLTGAYILDAALGARNLAGFTTYDALNGARVVGNMTLLERK